MTTASPPQPVLAFGADALKQGAMRPVGTQATATGVVMAGLFGAAFAGLFYYFFYVQGFQSWVKSEDWGHAFFVPLISLYLIWVRRAELSRVHPRPFWPGLVLVLLGVQCYALFQLSSLNNHMLRGGAVLLTLLGVCLMIGGPSLMRVLFFPIGYLVFAITLSERIMRDITFKLQLFASEGAYVLLNMVGVQTDLKGNVLEVHTETGVTPLNVAEACAGMRMVMGFVALGVAVALAGTAMWWKRVLLVLLGVPVALLMNVIRVAALGVLSMYNPNLATGQSHMLVGTILLVAAFFVYLGLVWCLHKAVPEPPEFAAPAGWTLWRAEPVRWRALRAPIVMVPLLLLVTAAVALPTAVASLGIHLKKKSIYAPENRTLLALAGETDSWLRIGKDVQESAEMVAELGTDNYVSRTYVQKNPPEGKKPVALHVHMTYYTGGIDTIPHVPERCMVGGGWNITGETRVVPISLDRSGLQPDPRTTSAEGKPIFTSTTPRGFSVAPDGARLSWSDAPGQRIALPRNLDELALRTTEFTEPKSGRRMLAGYFFIANGGIATSAEEVRRLAFDLTDDYSYYLKVQFAGEQAATPEELAEQASSLLGELFPEIMRCVPDWIEVQAGRYPTDNPRRAGAGAAKGPKLGTGGG